MLTKKVLVYDIVFAAAKIAVDPSSIMTSRTSTKREGGKKNTGHALKYLILKEH
jgi:hypothetical protein